MELELKELIEKEKEASIRLKYPYNISIKTMSDAIITDTDGKEYIDFTSNSEINSLGYNQPFISEIKQQFSDKPVCFSYLLQQPPLDDLIEKLGYISGLPHVFFSNSAGESFNVALSIIKTFISQAPFIPDKSEIIIFTDNKPSINLLKIHTLPEKKEFQQKNSFEFINSTPASISNMRNLFSKKVAAIIVNPLINIEGSFFIDNHFIGSVEKLCQKYQSLLVFDLTSVSPGRTGEILASGCKIPDMLLLSAGLGQDIQLGITAINGEIYEVVNKYYEHKHNFSVTACHILYKIIEKLEENDFQNLINEKSLYLKEKLNKLEEKYLNILDIQIKGLYATVEMDFNLTPLVEKCLEDGIILELATPEKLLIRPPYTITCDQIDCLFNVIDKHLNEMKSDYRLE
jgi:acetylornithine/succinyldiaminopimelate/putrescine aminotransferase